MDRQKQRLGRGLSALLGDEVPSRENKKSEHLFKVPISKINVNNFQPRQHFDEASLQQLTQSIRLHGIIQPLVLRPAKERDCYLLIAGERRWRAAQRAGLHEVPAVIMEADDLKSLEIAILENTQREDLNPIEQALGYKRLMDDFNYSYEALAQRMGKSRPYIINTVRLLQLPKTVQNYVEQGNLSQSHARTMVGYPDAKKLAQEVMEKGLSVRDVEKIVQKQKTPIERNVTSEAKISNPDIEQLAQELSNMWGMTIEIHEQNSQNGKLVVKYRNLEQLDLLIQRLMQ